MDSGSYISYYPSPIGILEVEFVVNSIKSMKFVEGKMNEIDCKGFYFDKKIRNTYNLIYDQLNEYFTGKRNKFKVNLSYKGTKFEKKVWSCIKNIPYGEVKSYRDIACEIGKENAVRAVGRACRKNPIIIFIPCHIVIKSNGETGGYAGKNYRKKWLVQHEKKHSCQEKKELGGQ